MPDLGSASTGVRPRSAPECVFDHTLRDQVVLRINHQRDLQGLPLFRIVPALEEAARLHAFDMHARGFLGATGPDGGSLQARVNATGYRGTCGAAFFDPATADPLPWESLWATSRDLLLNDRVRDLGLWMHGGRWALIVGVPTVSDTPAMIQRFETLLNRERQAAGAAPLAALDALNRAAHNHSEDMARRRYVAYAHPDGVGVISQARSAGYGGAVSALILLNFTAAEESLHRCLLNAQNRDLLLRADHRVMGLGVCDSLGTLLLGSSH